MEQERLSKARSSYLDFVKSIEIPGVPFNDDEDCEEFYADKVTPARHHHLIIKALQAVYDGEIKRLMIFCPPGSAKSTYTTVCFPPFVMGARPKTNIISTSYGFDLAKKFGRKCRSIVRSDEYGMIFDAGLSGDSAAAHEWALSNSSEYMAGGVLSGITGNRAYGLLIDDPVKGRRDADSPAIQKSTWEAYNDDLLTRLIPSGWQIIIQTRWNEKDLSGMLLPEEYDGRTGWVECSDGHEWYVICLPMECERNDCPLGRQPGDLLWDDWFIPDDVLKIKNASHKQRTWTALYQQRPAPDDGDYFKREWFNWYVEQPKQLRIYGASDYAVTDDGGDYTVHAVVGVDADDNIYILDIWREQTESDVWVETFLDLVNQWKPLKWGEEQGQINKSVGPFLVKRMREEKTYCAREQFVSATDKPTRARSFQARCSMGKVYLPKTAPWLDRFLTEFRAFPAGKNDDIVDACSLIGRMLDTMISAKKPKPPRKPENKWDRAFNKRNSGTQSWKTV